MKFPKKISEEKIKRYFLNLGLEFILKNYNFKEKNALDKRFSKKVYGPNILDLYRIHRFIIENKRTRVLEYGTGWSSLVIYHALEFNKKKFKKKPFPRIKKPFNLTIVDNSKKYLNISSRRIRKFFKKKNDINFHFSENKICTFNGRVASEFKVHPRINPDFIYLDGPDQFQVKGNINNMTVADYEFMPMSCDILKYENFLTPGTIILVDGRAANARFLKNNFQRNWIYKYDDNYDQSIFFLNEKPLGKLNKIQMDFYRS